MGSNMEITTLGIPGSFRIKGKKATLLLKPDALLFEERPDVKIAGPGEYEVLGVTIAGKRVNGEICYRLTVDGVRLFYIKKLPKSLEEVEHFLPIEVLLLGEYTHDVAELEPNIIVPFTDEIAKGLEKEAERSKKLTVSADKLPEDVKVVLLYG